MTAAADARCAEAMCSAAVRDLRTVLALSDQAPVESVGFHLQQAAERALKAWLAHLGEVYPLTPLTGCTTNRW